MTLMLIKTSFNTSYVSVQAFISKPIFLSISFQYILCVGSRVASSLFSLTAFMFQYILCVGSSLVHILHIFKQFSFNTSYVSVQDYKDILKKDDIEFQYILCVGSRIEI